MRILKSPIFTTEQTHALEQIYSEQNATLQTALSAAEEKFMLTSEETIPPYVTGLVLPGDD